MMAGEPILSSIADIVSMQASREIELEGHIIDSGIMTLVFDRIMDMGGNFEILIFDVGKKKTDPSYARLRVVASDPNQLAAILSDLHRYGARQLQVEDVRLVAAEADRVVPKGFYSTTNHPTSIKYRDQWLQVEDNEMDCLIVVDPALMAALCTPLSKLKMGDLVVIGEQGVRIIPPERPREQSTFEFMNGTVSPERPSETLIRNIAVEIRELKAKGGNFAGNALATHDIEYNLYGTSLGMDISTGKPVIGGHKHHLYAISEMMRAGSIRAAVEQGVITGGVMYECITNNVPFVLAGSIRDDGPLPDVITDVLEAQDAMREHIRGCGMVLMIGTLLHSIAVGNCLGSSVKTICVDINPSSVTKLMDRGTMQAIGVVSDAGTFLPLLAEQLIPDFRTRIIKPDRKSPVQTAE